MSESEATAVGHLEMICQAATGDYSLNQGELQKRKAAILAFFRTGKCLASDEDRELAKKVTELVNSHRQAA